MSFLGKILGWQTGGNETEVPAFRKEELGEISLWRFDSSVPGVNVAFTTRSGGVSLPPYESLNLGFHVGDLAENVRRNRQALSEALGIEPSRLTSPRQMHTHLVELIDDESHAGTGAYGEESDFDPCDGLLTSIRDLPILLHFADCTPVVLVCGSVGPPETSAVAVLHAGRRGLIGGVIEEGVDLMSRTYDVPRDKIIAAVGPAIGACCYQVDEEIASEFERRFGSDVVARDDESVWLNMQSAAEAALLLARIQKQKIHVLEKCTSCDSDFYSYRRDGTTGRHGAIAWVES